MNSKPIILQNVTTSSNNNNSTVSSKLPPINELLKTSVGFLRPVSVSSNPQQPLPQISTLTCNKYSSNTSTYGATIIGQQQQQQQQEVPPIPSTTIVRPAHQNFTGIAFRATTNAINVNVKPPMAVAAPRLVVVHSQKPQQSIQQQNTDLTRSSSSPPLVIVRPTEQGK